jgi:hypothetical protein
MIPFMTARASGCALALDWNGTVVDDVDRACVALALGPRLTLVPYWGISVTPR